MKYLSLILAFMFINISCFAQIESNINKAEKQIEEGFPKDAEQLLDSTLKIMDCSENIPLFVKANILYITTISQYEEDAVKESIKKLESTLSKCKSPATEIFHSYLGELYANFFVSSSRKTDSENSDDIDTWSAERVQKMSKEHYLLSLENSTISQTQLIENYKIILSEEKNKSNLTPTIYDVLFYRFINSCKRELSTANFPELLTPLNEFIQLKWNVDENNTSSIAVTEFQKLLMFHLTRSHSVLTVMYPKDAMIYSDIQRLAFFDPENKNIDLRIKALDYLIKTYQQEKAVTLAYFEKAQLLNMKSYDDENKENRYTKVDAVNICDEAIKLFPESEGAENCSKLKAEIQKVEFSMTSEIDAPVNKPALIKIDFKNVNKLYFFIYEVSEKVYKQFVLSNQYNNDDYCRNILTNFKPIKTWNIEFPDTKDYRFHSTEAEIPELNSGNYLIFTSLYDNLNVDSAYSVANHTISNIFPVLLKENNIQNTILVVDRSNGKPLKDVQVKYYQNNKGEIKEINSSKTDENGLVSIPNLLDKKRIYIKFESGNDSYWSDEIYLRNYDRNLKEKINIQLFTDRAVYRPGQTVYYKGIVYRTGEESLKVAPNYSNNLSVRDQNYQEIVNQKVASDEFGGFNGSFVIPKNILNGNISIQVNDAYNYIKVEEYKRARFEVTLEHPKTELSIDKEVIVEGKALMLNGLPLQNATVTYTVSRSNYWLRYGFYNNQEDEIISGTTTTKEDGSFSIPFIAKSSNNERGYPFYRFCVNTSVTDITGEVQQSNICIAIGKEPVNIQLNVNDVMVIGENDQLNFDIINTESLSLPMKSTLVIEKLNQPKKIYSERKWEIPDIQIIPKEEFEKKFPHLTYEKQLDLEGKEIFRKDFSEKEERALDLKTLNLLSGSYRFIITTINSQGEKVEKKATSNILNMNDKKCNIKKDILFSISSSSVNIGETVTLYYASAVKNAKLFYVLTTQKGKSEKKWIEIGGKNGKIEIPVDETMRSGIAVYLSTCINNTYYNFAQNISVNDPKQYLKMEISGIRDKTLPNAEETWRVKILDNENQPVSASMFAGMYDMALDQFGTSYWNFSPTPLLYTPSLFISNLGGSINFAYSKNRYIPVEYSYFNPQNLNWFNFSYWRNYRGGKGIPIYTKASIMEVAIIEDKVDFMSNEEISQQQEANSVENIRQNFNETAFFYPDLRSDKSGNMVLEFKMPETTTRWKMRGIAYTKSLQTVYYDTVIITKSDLLVMPNLPRFLRSGDQCSLITRISNSSDKTMKGVAKINLEDLITGQSLNHIIEGEINKSFVIEAGQSITVSWNVNVTNDSDLLQITMTATSGEITDGEKHIIPVFQSDAIALETVAIELSKEGSHSFTLDNLGKEEAQPQNLTIECTTNPIWFAIQALPTIAEPKFESTDNIFNALYSNILSEYIINSNEEIKNVFDVWSNYEPDAFMSSLEQNQELKNILLNETPWVAEAKNETEQKQQLASLFDINQMNYNKLLNLNKLKQRQQDNGAFIWFPDMNESRYITQYIVTSIGKLKEIGLSSFELNNMAEKAVVYLDNKIKEDQIKYPKTFNYDVEYLFARSYFLNVEMDAKTTEIVNIIVDYSIKNQTKIGFNYRAKLALALQRMDKIKEAKNIALSLDNYGLGNKHTGKYWRTQQGSVNASDISLSALMANVYKNVLNDNNSLLEVQKYLIRNKRTNQWINTTATVDAVYALITGENRLDKNNPVTIQIGKEIINSETEKGQAGSGYFKRSFSKSEITSDMKNIVVQTTNDNLLFGGIYFQYQIPVDKIAKSKNQDISIDKKLFVTQIENGKTIYTPIENNTLLKKGDKIVVRLTIKSNRDMEFVHLNDMRGGAFEPVESVSSYVWHSDLSYYRDVKDASINMFFEKVPRGTFIIEYELWATQDGTFSNGFSKIQCLYAPEFYGNSDGERLKIKN